MGSRPSWVRIPPSPPIDRSPHFPASRQAVLVTSSLTLGSVARPRNAALRSPECGSAPRRGAGGLAALVDPPAEGAGAGSYRAALAGGVGRLQPIRSVRS